MGVQRSLYFPSTFREVFLTTKEQEKCLRSVFKMGVKLDCFIESKRKSKNFGWKIRYRKSHPDAIFMCMTIPYKWSRHYRRPTRFGFRNFFSLKTNRRCNRFGCWIQPTYAPTLDFFPRIQWFIYTIIMPILGFLGKKIRRNVKVISFVNAIFCLYFIRDRKFYR